MGCPHFSQKQNVCVCVCETIYEDCNKLKKIKMNTLKIIYINKPLKYLFNC